MPKKQHDAAPEDMGTPVQAPNQTLKSSAPKSAAPRAAQPAVASNKPMRTPDEWGMHGIKVSKRTEISNAPDGRQIRKVILECKELDESVLVEKNVDYTTTDSNGVEEYVSRPPKRVYVPAKELDTYLAKGYELVEPQPDWRVFALKD